jgi:signal recognition particle subunit SRP54
MQQIVIINSMTRQERSDPDIINNSRKQRIAQGSGTDVQDINKMLKQFEQMQKMMKKFKKGNLLGMMRGMKGNMTRGMPFRGGGV